jgi:hypothetical protein
MRRPQILQMGADFFLRKSAESAEMKFTPEFAKKFQPMPSSQSA